MNNNLKHPNALVMQKLFEVFGRAIPEEMLEVFHEDIVWHFPGSSVISGEWKGIDGILNGIRANALKYGRAMEGLYGFEPLQFFGNDDYGVSLHHDFYKGDDNHFKMQFIIMAKIVDGKIKELWELPFDLYENDRFWKQQQISIDK
jgi:uncharacterized protein